MSRVAGTFIVKGDSFILATIEDDGFGISGPGRQFNLVNAGFFVPLIRAKRLDRLI